MDKQEIVIVDISIPLRSMVIFMLKLAVAAIPAVIILFMLAFVLLVLPNYLPRL